MRITTYALPITARRAAATSGATFVAVSPSRQRELAAAYRSLPMLDRDALPAWRAMREETLRQLDALIAAGIDVVVDDVDPYARTLPDGGTAPDAAAMMDDLRLNGRIRVLGTHITGSHPVWSDDDNDAFRAVHDVFGHAATGRGFDRHGEEAAYRAHARLYSPLARRALTTETRGQNATLVHSTDGSTFDVQRVAILPARWLTRSALVPTAAEAAAAVRHARECHAAACLDWQAPTS